jgi:hypothetical protein
MTWFDVLMSYAGLAVFSWLAADSYVRSQRDISEAKRTGLLTLMLVLICLLALGVVRLAAEMV